MTDVTTAVEPTTDELFAQPFIDLDEWRDAPVRHRYVHGGFEGTETLFSFYLPPAERYEGRFFQYITPVPDSEHTSQHEVGEEDRISMAIESGAYFVETNGGGPRAADPFSGLDQSIGAYRANAATAQFSRVVAAEMYGGERPYGYAFGGSGGGFRTIGGVENTADVWDGTVPFVIGSPLAIPNCFTARMQALRVLRGKFDGIVDAMEPGGSGNPYADLDEEQAAVLLEVTRLGFPLASWFGHKTMGLHGLAALYPGVRAMDPTYFDEFWTEPGYVGSDPTASVHRDRVQHTTTVAAVLTVDDLVALGYDRAQLPGQSRGTADDGWLGGGNSPFAGVRLAEASPVSHTASELVILSGASAGARVVLLSLDGDLAVFGPSDAGMLAAIAAGDEVTVDNSGFLAIETYHRHQVPGPEFAVWDQFRDADGTPLYPQRSFLVGPIFAAGAAGSVQTGRFTGHMIVVESLLDREAYPWQADWYRQRVIEHLGAETDDRFRLWMTDHALHGDSELQDNRAHTVSYLGMLHQALRDVSAWVERGIVPAETTRYEVVDGAVIVPATAAERRGIQPVVTLSANGATSIEISAGDTVVLRADADTPGNGSIVQFEWDADGDTDFELVTPVDAAASATAETTVSFPTPGTYFPTVRVVARRDAAATSAFARLQNIARVRVTVN